MAFAFVKYLVFASGVALAYYLMPERFRWRVLLLASYLYYWVHSKALVLVLFGTTLVTFLFGLWLDYNKSCLKNFPADLDKEKKKVAKEKSKRFGKRILTIGILLDLGILLFLKYYNFFGETANSLFGSFGVNVPHLSLLLPLGISFYTLQAIAYLIDINRGRINADKNLLKFMLFLSFFPQITQGPIARHSQLAEQLYKGHEFDFRRICYGFQIMLWGMMKKLIIADRLAIPVSYLFDNYSLFHGSIILFAGLLYGLQVYADFSGGMDIARGIAQLFGVELEQNFKQPYYSHSIEEFWRRWHITLGAWMRDYVFYPLSLSKAFSRIGKQSRRLFGQFVGKRIPAFLAMFIVYFLVGVWHGAEWKYIGYGIWNGIFIMASLLLPNVYSKMRTLLRIEEDTWSWRGFQIIRTVYICSLGRFFSRAADWRSALQMIKSSFGRWYDISFLVDGSLNHIGLNTANWLVCLFAVVMLFYIDYLHEKGICIRESVAQQSLLFRWLLYICAIVSLIIFGVYGSGDPASGFIYEQF